MDLKSPKFLAHPIFWKEGSVRLGTQALNEDVANLKALLVFFRLEKFDKGIAPIQQRTGRNSTTKDGEKSWGLGFWSGRGLLVEVSVLE